MLYPHRIASTTIASLDKYLCGEDVPAKTLIPPTVYRAADAATDPESK